MISMINSLKIKIKFIITKYKWKKKNINNFTSPKKICNVDKIDIGDYTYGKINAETFGNPDAHLTIGRFCSIAQNVRFILDGEHDMTKLSLYPFKVRLFKENYEALCKGPIIVEDDVWIGERSIILSGVRIGQGAVIGAGSIVTKDIPPYSVFAGNRIIRYRFSEDIITKLCNFDYKKLNKQLLNDNLEYLYQDLDESFFESELYKKCSKNN